MVRGGFRITAEKLFKTFPLKFSTMVFTGSLTQVDTMEAITKSLSF
jgi:hypothetical protein